MQLLTLLRSSLLSTVMVLALLLGGVVAAHTSVLDQPHVPPATVSVDARARMSPATAGSDPVSSHPIGSESPCRFICAGPDEDCVGLPSRSFALSAWLPAPVWPRRIDATRVLARPGLQWDHAAVSLLLLSVSRT